MAAEQGLSCCILADDSGLSVDALDGAPGVYSARWAGEDASDADLIAKLLHEMRNVPDGQRGAHFVAGDGPKGHAERSDHSCTSDTLPSRMCRLLTACFATSGSWVMRTMVFP